jgi:hypothetical protein
MWLLAFALGFQVAVITELALNRIVMLLCNARRDPVRRFADNSFCGSMLALVVSLLTTPISIAAAAAQIFMSYFFFWVGLGIVVAVLAAVSETSSSLIVVYVNAYNSGVGQALNELLVLVFELVAPFWRAVVPIYNALVYLIAGFWKDVMLPIVFVNAKLLPDVIVNFTVLLGSIASGMQEWFTRLSTCTQKNTYSDNATSPFWVNDLSCVGNAHYMTLDLMTPALYAQRSATTLQAILTTSCVPVTNTLTLVIYPLLDINLYKAIHGLVNTFLHGLISLPILTRNRCLYAHETTDYAYTDVEKMMMCMPDVAPLTTVAVSTLRSTGMLVDNWLDTVLVVAENSVTGVVRSCAAPALPLVWRNASDVFGTSEMRVVGLTPSLYAITDADSIVYHSMVGASLRVAYALHAWPFKIDLSAGVAAVMYNAVPDVDDAGDGRTGLLGCRCVDADAGIEVVCASVPFQHHLADDVQQLLEYTVHHVRFVPDSARAGLTCARVTIRVEALRFSRRRFSAPGAGRVELGFDDEFNTRQQYGSRAASAHAADAAIVVTPSCAVHASVLCIPSIENCFPFCLGLHAAGQRSQNISLMNAQRWDEWTSLGQTDCVVANAVGGSCASDTSSRLLQNEEAGVQVPGCAKTACVPDAASVTFMKNSENSPQNRSLQAWQEQQGWGAVRSSLQPFIAAGDVFLYQIPTDDVSGQIAVTRLYDNKRGDFSLQQEKLSLLTNSVPMQYRQCTDEECYAEQLRENRIVLPYDYFIGSNPTKAASSEWAVHWTATPSTSKCAAVADFCADTMRDESLIYKAHRPRLWTVRTVRHTQGLGLPFTEEALASYMIIPDWFSCSKEDFLQNTQCKRMYNMKVTGLEYINADNLLLTVLAATPRDWDWQSEDVFAGRAFEYRFYFVHPNRHDCTDPNDAQTMYTCWRSAEDGMFSAPDTSVSETGALCPMLQRMPKWGSMVTEVLVAQVQLVRVALDALFVFPLIVRGGIGDLFEQRARPTFHAFLDASGNTLFDLEDTLQAMQLSAFYMAGTFSRTATLMQTLGVQELETVLIGTARVFEYTKAASMVEDVVFGQTAQSVSGPYGRLVSSFGSSTTDAAPLSTPGTPVSLSTDGSTRWVRVFQSIAGPSVSWSRITVKVLRKMLLKAIRKGELKRLVAREMVSTLLTSVYESEQDIARGMLDNMKTICDATGQIIGRTNSWGEAVRHSCLLVPESMQAVMKTTLILTIDYQVMDCVCKQTEGFVVEDVLNNVCLPRILPMARKAFVMDSIAQKSTSQCFNVMDAVNDRLLRVFDPVFARMVKAQTAIESAFGLLLTQVIGMDSMDMKCTAYDSPFVVSIVPEPVDYFMGCMQTFDCRARCLDTMQAFDDALRDYSAHSEIPLAYVSQSTVETESRFFSYEDMEAGKHLAPFAVYAVAQLPPSACVVVCPSERARCVAVSGMRRGALAVAYYCVPASLVMSVYEGVALKAEYNAEVYRSRSVLDIQFATVHKRELGSSEWLVVHARDDSSSETSVWVLAGGVADASWLLLETQSYNPVTVVRTSDLNDPAWPAETVTRVFVLPAHAGRTTATVFVSGTIRAEDGDTDMVFCFYVFVDTSVEGVGVDLTRHSCRGSPFDSADTHATVCLDYECKQAVYIPVDGGTELRLETFKGYTTDVFDWSAVSRRVLSMPKDQRKLLDVDRVAALSISQDRTLQFTRRTLSPFGSITRGSFDADKLSIDVPLTGRGKAEETWLQNVRLKLNAASAEVSVAASFTEQQRLDIVVNCTVTTCVGCHGSHPLQIDLQNKCFAAASCGIAKCVGTPVNMKRPLCQMASMLGLQISFVRLNLQSFWDFFSRMMITIVELTQSRRQLYEISTAQEKTMATVCSAKDGIVQSMAIFGALYAQVPALTLDRASREPVSLQELRVNTERVMVATAVVQFLSQIGLAVVYVPLVSSKIMQCQLNDAFLIVEGIGNMISQAATQKNVVKFRMGSAKLDKINEFAVGMCLTDRFKQDMRDIADPAREHSILSGLQDVIDGITGLVTTAKVAMTAFSLDAFCAWVLGVLAGTMNLMQVVDSENCRLPATDTLVVGSCVCGDMPARIPDRQRESKRTDALWCRGPLVMTNILGNDVLVWNPYSLAELFLQNKVQAYFDCLVVWSGDQRRCIGVKPVNSFFEAQGVDILQVIIRCRSNYQQKRWDEGSVLLGLLEKAEDWSPASVQSNALVQMYRQTDGSVQTLRLRLAQISKSISGIDDLDTEAFSCLRAALFANEWNHNCAELALSRRIFEQADSLLTYFAYGAYEVDGKMRADAATFEHTDACESFSGSIKARSSTGISYPRMAWDGDSKNTVPVAELHNKLQGNSAVRIQQAEARVADLIRTKIAPAFDAAYDSAIHEIDTEFVSFEGDALHQVVDCVVLGPYAAADMLPRHKTLRDAFPVPQYHRGNPKSREIMYDMRTQGSPARKRIVHEVVRHVSNKTSEKVQELVLDVIRTLQQAYTEPSNLLCTCLGSARPSIECCTSNKAMHTDLLQFATTFSAQSVLRKIQDLHETFTASLADDATQASVLRDIWFQPSASIDAELSEEQRRVLANDYAFDYNQSVREYSTHEVPRHLNSTLWSYCIQSLESVFFTMPLRVAFDGSATVDAETRFDPSTSTAADAARYLHGMEGVIEKVLEKAKLHAPTYWSHVHRYMPSDSVWCEETSRRSAPRQRHATYPAEWNGLQFAEQRVSAPNVDELLYVSRLGSSCACGLDLTDGTCSVPPGLCARMSANGSRWSAICSTGTYSAGSDVLLVRMALYNLPDIMPECDELQANTAWGLFDTKQHMDWYNGEANQQDVSLHEVAAHGPSGVRLAMFLREHAAGDADWQIPRAPPVDVQQAYNPLFKHTVAQPFCRSTQQALFKEHLGDYFRDVLFPMAHAVHEAPSQVICARWVIEYALYVAIREMTGTTSTATAEQRLVEEQWRARCTYQIEIVGMCHLRDVYSLAPPGMQDTTHCKFTLPERECHQFFVTESCLLMCDGHLYDPCLCDNAESCSVVFTKDTCASGRRFGPLKVDADMDSLHWPETVWPPDTVQQKDLDAFLAASVEKRLTLHTDMFEFIKHQSAREEGAVPDAFCDELLDYMDPEAQHPVGYHPTCACDRRETNMRGFDAWMSAVRDSEHAYSIDPVRMRNMSMYSTTLGASHLVCDAVAYGAGGAQLNPLRMQSKWSATARADPAMPVYADTASEETMTVASPSNDQHDSPLRAAAASDVIFRHSVGLVRDWLRDYEDAAGQAELDKLWPHWLDVGETFAAPSSDTLHDGCSMPQLLRCYEDSDCSSSDSSLRCKRNQAVGTLGEQGERGGICVRSDTCFQHAHCSDGTLCSGTGVCKEPQIIVHNTLAKPINVRVAAKKSKLCKGSAFGASVFQQVPTFARDNGLCGVHNLFNYRNLTYDLRPLQDRESIKSVAGRSARFIPDAFSLLEVADPDSDDARNALKMQANACDREYEYTDYPLCLPAKDTPLETFQSTRTWRQDDTQLKVDFCHLQVGRGAFAALTSPYTKYDENGEAADTLQHTETTIRQCTKFSICPSPVFTVGGQRVDRLIWQPSGLAEYPLHFAAQCMSFGLWDGTQCRVDTLIVPLMRVLFRDATDVPTLDAPFAALREECPLAFGADRAEALYRFQSTYVLLTEPYSPINTLVPHDMRSCAGLMDKSIQCVAVTINGLILEIFGLPHERRGLGTMDEYKRKARCATHIFRQLRAVQVENAERMREFNIAEKNVPGATFYMFTGHFPVEVPLSWFWTCVLIATNTEGGAQVDWHEVITNPDAPNRLQCTNILLDDPQGDTLREHLQVQADIYSTDKVAASAGDVYDQLLEVMRNAVDYWDVTSIPTLVCKEEHTEQLLGACATVLQYTHEDKACWNRAPSTDAKTLVYHQDSLTQCRGTDKKCTLFDVMFHFIFGRSSTALRQNTVLTVDWMVEQKIALRIGLDSKLSSLFSHANMIPEIEFQKLLDLNQSLIHSPSPSLYTVDYVADPKCDVSRRQTRLGRAEYQIPKRVLDNNELGEGEFRVFRRISGLEEMREAVGEQNEEVYQLYDLASVESARYVSISQKQMLLLALYYLRETMYLGVKATFGTMKYIDDVRVSMRKERQMARDFSVSLGRSKFYDHVVKLQNFDCPADLRIAEAAPSELQQQLKSCLQELKTDLGWKVAADARLVARADADMLLSGFYVSFAAQQGPTFLDELVNTDWHLQQPPSATRLCFATPGGAAPLMPLWSGLLDLQSCPSGKSCGCQLASQDVTTAFDLTCDKSTEIDSCKGDFPAFYEHAKRAMYDKCWRLQGELVGVRQYEQMHDGNLCSRQPASVDTCALHFGAQGRVLGRTRNDLHRRATVRRVQQGLFSPNNTLFRGRAVADAMEITAMQLLPTDIGGHSIGLVARFVGGKTSRSAVLDVACVAAGKSCLDTSFSTWLSTVAGAWAVQHNAHTVRYKLGNVAASATHWRCPLQWLSAYSDKNVSYTARSPAADRNRVRFHHITKHSAYAHATVIETVRVAQHPARFLSDRSACVDAVLEGGTMRFRCQGSPLLLDALDAHRGRWAVTRFMAGNTPNCKRFLDWPHVYSKTVDGQVPDKNEAASYCNVFWRLPSFALRYVARKDSTLLEKPRDAILPGSACHMGRLRQVQLEETDTAQFCTKYATHTRCRFLRREAPGEYKWYDGEIPFEPPFAAKRRPARRNRRCSTCDRHDTASFIDRRLRETPLKGHTPQLSVGQPTTVATERLLAATLRRHACPDGPSAPCPAQYELFDESLWKRGRLLDAMLDAATRFQQKDTPTVSDASLWSAPWVACKRIQNVTSCRGSITRNEWRDPHTRIDACLREMKDTTSSGPSSMDFCMLSEATAALCSKIADWNAEITHILCNAGDHAKCTSRAFYYNPSQYSASNKDFVYNSVASLYVKLNSSACLLETQAQAESNRNNVHLCSSTQVEPFVVIVKLLRLVLRKLVMIFYYAIQVLFATTGLVVSHLLDTPGATAEYFTDSLYRFVHLLLTVSAQALEQIWQIAFSLLDFGDLAFIKQISMWSCLFVQNVIVPIVQVVIIPMIGTVVTVLKAIDDAICVVSLRQFCGKIPIGNLQDTQSMLRGFRPSCNNSNTRTLTKQGTSLPVATRCWATYNTFYGDSGRLSCTAADTCNRGITDFSLQMCGACASFDDYMPFGCYDVTKTCTCNLPLLAEQGCSSNEECAAPDATCRFVDRELRPSIGFTKCAACQTKRVCLVTPGRSDGFCACGLVDIGLQRCVAQSKPAMPAYDKLCIYTQDYRFLLSTKYVFSFYTSMTAPCNDLNPASTYCARESSDDQLYVVGVDAVGRRRLLSTEESMMTAADTQNSLCQDALSSDSMPAHRSACQAAYDYSRETLSNLDLPSGLAPCTFCSVEDVVHNLLLQPHNLVMLVSNVSQVTHVFLRHTPARYLVQSATAMQKHINTAVQIAAVEPALAVEHTNGSWHVQALVDHASVETLAQVLRFVLPFVPSPRAQANESQTNATYGRVTRHLLTVDDVAEAVQQNFRVSKALRQAFATQLASSLDYAFEAPAAQREWMNTWPPKIGTEVLQADLCPPLTNMLRTTMRVMDTIDVAYTMQKQALPVSSVDKAWINISRRGEVNVSWADYTAARASNDPVVAAVLFVADRALAAVNLSPDGVFDVLAAAADELWTFIRCDYESVQTCSKWRVNVLVASIVVAFYYIGVYIVCAAIGLSMPVLLAAGALPSIILYMSYGYAPLCFPAVPACLYDDLVSTIQQLVPKNIELPGVMYRSQACMSAAASRVEVKCLRTCTDEPFAFLEWYDVLAWWSLEVGVEARMAAFAQQPLMSVVLGEQTQDDIQAALDFHTRVFETPDIALLTTKRVCAVLSLYKLMPYLAILFVVVMLALASLQVLQQTVSVAVQTTCVLLVSAFH